MSLEAGARRRGVLCGLACSQARLTWPLPREWDDAQLEARRGKSRQKSRWTGEPSRAVLEATLAPFYS